MKNRVHFEHGFLISKITGKQLHLQGGFAIMKMVKTNKRRKFYG